MSSQRRHCATVAPNTYQIKRNDKRLSDSKKRVKSNQEVYIDIQFIHIQNGKTGRITPSFRKKQVKVLNQVFNPYDIFFGYDEEQVRTVDNPKWYTMDINTAEEREAKQAMHGSPERHLNFYTAGLQEDSLGWATFPWMLQGDRVMDGVVIQNQTLPGGSLENYDLGITAVHEVAHWLGLYHTFEGGCNGVGDHIDDTPPHIGPNYEDPDDTQPNGACNIGELAPVHNYMNYCYDRLLTEFTSKQVTRMKNHIAEYRQTFLRKKT